MTFRQDLPSELKYRERRRGVRVNSRVPLAIEWETEAGSLRRAEAHTRVVNPYGCLLVLRAEFGVEQKVSVTNLANQATNAGVVVWKGNERVEGVEFGIELLDPPMDFWGLDL